MDDKRSTNGGRSPEVSVRRGGQRKIAIGAMSPLAIVAAAAMLWPGGAIAGPQRADASPSPTTIGREAAKVVKTKESGGTKEGTKGKKGTKGTKGKKGKKGKKGTKAATKGTKSGEVSQLKVEATKGTTGTKGSTGTKGTKGTKGKTGTKGTKGKKGSSKGTKKGGPGKTVPSK